MSVGLGSPEGLAVDWVSRTLFWTDSEMDRIEVASLDGKYRKVIIDENLVNPRAIVVDPTQGYVIRDTFYNFMLYAMLS